MSKLQVLSRGGLAEAVEIAKGVPKRRTGHWRNPVILPARIKLSATERWGPGYKLGVYRWPSREVAEQKALDWLALYTSLGWLKKYGTPKLLPPKFIPDEG